MQKFLHPVNYPINSDSMTKWGGSWLYSGLIATHAVILSWANLGVYKCIYVQIVEVSRFQIFFLSKMFFLLGKTHLEVIRGHSRQCSGYPVRLRLNVTPPTFKAHAIAIWAIFSAQWYIFKKWSKIALLKQICWEKCEESERNMYSRENMVFPRGEMPKLYIFKRPYFLELTKKLRKL